MTELYLRNEPADFCILFLTVASVHLEICYLGTCELCARGETGKEGEGLVEFNGILSFRPFNVCKDPKVLTRDENKQIVRSDALAVARAGSIRLTHAPPLARDRTSSREASGKPLYRNASG